jgi:hypothetical protein
LGKRTLITAISESHTPIIAGKTGFHQQPARRLLLVADKLQFELSIDDCRWRAARDIELAGRGGFRSVTMQRSKKITG